METTGAARVRGGAAVAGAVLACHLRRAGAPSARAALTDGSER